MPDRAPPGFLWGAATAGVQVEGALPTADWALFAASPAIRRRLRLLGRLFGLDLDPQPFGPAVRHFNTGRGDRLRFVAEDLDRARALGRNAYRFSVEWSRVQPRESGVIDPEAITYYQAVARAGHLTAGARRQAFELYLSARADGTLLGLLYYGPGEQGIAADLWVALGDLQGDDGRLRFAHEPVPGRVGSAIYVVARQADPRVITGQATVGGGEWQVTAELQPLGFYTAPAGAALTDPRFWNGTWGVGGHAWAPLIITRYQQNSGISNARQLLDSWRHRECAPMGGSVPLGGAITLALLPTRPQAADRLPPPLPRKLIFTGSTLVNAAGETIFERAPDGVKL
jgi:hypothetical protein